MDCSIPPAKVSDEMRENQGVPKRKCNLLGSPPSRSEISGNLSNFDAVPLGWTISYFQKLRTQAIIWGGDLTVKHENDYKPGAYHSGEWQKGCLEIRGVCSVEQLTKCWRRIRKTYQLHTGQFNNFNLRKRKIWRGTMRSIQFDSESWRAKCIEHSCEKIK